MKAPSRAWIAIVTIGIHANVGSSGPINETSRLLASPPTQASDTPYILHHWGRDEGMPQNSATTVIQTRDGYIWLGTLGGVARFDGVRFTTFDIATNPGLLDNRIQALFEDRSGAVWIGHDLAGISVYRNGAFKGYSSKDGMPSERVNAITQDGDGAIWIATTDGLVRFDDGTFRTFKEADGLPSNSIRSLYPGADGTLWVGTGRGLARLGNVEATRFEHFATHMESPVQAIIETGDVLWIGTPDGLFRRNGDQFYNQPLPHGLTSTGIRLGVGTLALDGANHLWVAAPGDGARLYRFEPDRTAGPDSFEFASGASVALEVFAIFEDPEGSLWLGGRGLTRLRRRRVFRYSTESGLPRESRAVVTDGDGGIWVGSSCPRPLSRIKNGRVETVTHSRDGRAIGCAASLLREDRTLWIGSDGVLVRYEEGEQTRFELPDEVEDGLILALLRDRDGSLWLGTQSSGLLKFHQGRFRRYTTADGLVADEIRFLTQSRDGTIWVGTGRGMSRFDGGSFSNYTAENGLPPGMVRAIYEDADGALWIGTYGGGLARLVDDVFTRYTTDHGLFDNVVSRILEDDDGNLWMLGNLGLFFTSRAELNAMAEGRARSIRSVSVDSSEGMVEGQGGAMPAGWKLQDGSMWWPTINGVVHIDAKNFRTNEIPPATAIERVLVNHREATPRADAVIEIPPGLRELEVHYTGLSLVAPHKTRFRYMLEGFDDVWSEVDRRRVAVYTNVPPGSYRFRVQATNNDGVWSSGGAAVQVAVPPLFYERRAFGIAALAASLAFAFCVFRLSLRSIRARNRRLQEQIDEVHARMQAEAGLRESEARYRSLLENAPLGIMEFDYAGRLISINETGRNLLGYDDDSVLRDRNYLDLVPQSHREEVAAHLESARAGRSATVQISVGKDDNLRTLSQGLFPVFDNHGVVVKLIGVALDISDRMKTEAALRRSEEQLRQAQKMEAVGLLAGGVAHDFNNILTVIGGYSELLLNTSLDNPRATRSGLENISDASDRAASLTQQLLAFSRRQVLKSEVLDLRSVLDKTESILKRIIGEDIELRKTTSSDGARSKVKADPGQIGQVIMNLAINARDAMPDGGALTLGVRDMDVGEDYTRLRDGLQPGSYTVLTVEDTGVGMSNENLSRIFEPFFTTKERGRGTGLGLSTVYGIVKQSNGYVDVTSELGRGTRFRIFLPRVHDALTETKETHTDKSPGTGTILLAEDDSEVRSLVREILTSNGYTVLDAMNGDQALSIIDGESKKIDLLMTDVIMPRMKGDELAKELTSRYPALKVLYITGYGGESAPSIDPGSLEAELLKKPFTSEALLAKVAEVLSRQ